MAKKKEQKTDKKYREKLYDIYLKERSNLVIAQREQAYSFDKNMLYIGAGALVLSLSFASGLDAVKDSSILWILFGWSGLILTILMIIISIFLSQYACSRQLCILEKEYAKYFSEKCETDQENEKQVRNYYSQIIVILNILSIVFLIVSIGCVVRFVVLNFI